MAASIEHYLAKCGDGDSRWRIAPRARVRPPRCVRPDTNSLHLRCLRAALFATLLLGAGNAGAETLHRYTVTPDSDLNALAVEACFDGAPPAYLTTTERRASRYLKSVTTAAGKRLKVGRRRRISLHALADDGCVKYAVDQRRVRIDSRWFSETRIGRSRMMPFGIWLWRPEKLSVDTDIELRFERVRYINISAPWWLVERSAERVVYRVGHTPRSWSSAVVLGWFETHEVRLPGTTLRVAILDGTPPARSGEIDQWLGHAARSVAGIYGRFPLATAQIIIVPLGANREAVPFGHVMRGGGSAVRFFVDQTRPAREYMTDWTTVHELTHLTHPLFQDEDRWLAEGIASYYQHVLRARSGMLTRRQAWQKLYEGFQRGVDGTNRRSTLLQATDGGWNRSSIMRIYWSGAAIALFADLELRERSAGEQSLDTALGAFQTCCLPSDRLWTAQEFFDQLDELTRTAVFTELYDAHTRERRFPDFSPAFRRLGLKIVDGKVQLADAAPLAAHRVAIMQYAD